MSLKGCKHPMCAAFFICEVATGFDAAKGKQQVMAPSGKEMLEFLSGPALPRDKELYVRVWAWRSANDAWRRNPTPTKSCAEPSESNTVHGRPRSEGGFTFTPA